MYGWPPGVAYTPIFAPGTCSLRTPSAHTVQFAHMVGAMMAARITGADSPISLTPFRGDRFAGRAGSGTFVSSYLAAEGSEEVRP